MSGQDAGVAIFVEILRGGSQRARLKRRKKRDKKISINRKSDAVVHLNSHNFPKFANPNVNPHFLSTSPNEMIMMSTELPLYNRPLCSSIMAHPVAEQKIEIQGSYWPRLMLREMHHGKKNHSKKAHKAMKSVKNYSSYSSSATMKLPLSGTTTTTSLFDLLKEVPPLASEDHFASRSPVTGKPILSPKQKGSLLVPTKPFRKHLGRRSHSNDSSFTLD